MIEFHESAELPTKSSWELGIGAFDRQQGVKQFLPLRQEIYWELDLVVWSTRKEAWSIYLYFPFETN